jgi:hypothetical protein
MAGVSALATGDSAGACCAFAPWLASATTTAATAVAQRVLWNIVMVDWDFM